MTAMEHYLYIGRDSREDAETFKRLWLITDGTLYHCFKENFGMGGKSVEETVMQIKETTPEDDATYVSIEW